MGTTPNGKRPPNDITISRSNTNKSVDPKSGKSTVAGPGTADAEAAKQPERSFAQPSPVSPPKALTPKTHASEKDEKDALKKNSTLKPLPKVDAKTEEKPEETKDAE